MDTLSFLLDMPLLSVFGFQESAFSRPIDEVVDDLLEQAHELK